MGSDAQKEETPVPVTATNGGKGSSKVNVQRHGSRVLQRCCRVVDYNCVQISEPTCRDKAIGLQNGQAITAHSKGPVHGK